MSTTRVVLVAFQALCNQLALTPPNPTPPKRRYHTDQLYVLQIAPLVFKCHRIIAWACTMLEILYYLLHTITFSSPITNFASSLVCIPAQSHIRLTPSFILGVIAVILGSCIRLSCFRTLGDMFTFDLTVHPSHRLVTTHLYSYVRHPAYTGSMLLVLGLTFSHLTRGSWMTECGPLRAPGSALMVSALWWLWTLCVGISRAVAEDGQMKKLFNDEWDTYAMNVHWWFFPGLI